MESTRTLRGATALLLGLALVSLGTVGCGDDAPPPMAPETEAGAPAVEHARVVPPPRPASTRTVRNEENRAPKIRSLAIVSDDENPALWRARFETVDADGDDVEVDVVWRVNGEPAARGEATFDPTRQREGDVVTVEVTPHDGKAAGATARSGEIRIANAAPTITSTPSAAMAGGVYRYMVEAEDPEGNAPLRFSLAQSPAGMRIDPYSGELTWRPEASQAGQHTVVIEVADSRGARSTQEFVLPIMAPGAVPAAPAP